MHGLTQLVKLCDRVVNVVRKQREEPRKVTLAELKDPALLSKFVAISSHDDVIEEYKVGNALIRIIETDRGLTYKVVEPELPLDRSNFHEICRDVIYKSYELAKESISEEVLFEAFLKVCEDRKISEDIIPPLWYYFERDFIKYDVLTPLLEDPNVEDISCAGYGCPVYVYHRKYGFVPTNIVFSEDNLDEFVQKLAQKCKVDLTFATPFRDASTKEGYRISLTFKSVSTKGSTFTIRKPKSTPFTPVDLIKAGVFTKEQVALLWLAILSKCSVMFIGATGSGKTTALNAFSLLIPVHSKVISIEDTKEINLPFHKNWVSIVCEDFTAAIKSSLRQRPEYLIVGEARGIETKLMFQAMSLGHTTLSTFHAGGLHELISRLKSEPLSLPDSTISLLNFVVFLKCLNEAGRVVRKCVGLYHLNTDGKGLRLFSSDLYYRDITKNPEPDDFFENRLPNYEDVYCELLKKIELATTNGDFYGLIGGI
jgi:flagellar protein FlaI